MIVTRIRDGLGNQMFQYAAARALALRLGDPKIVLAVGEDAAANFRKFELDAFDLPVSYPNRLDKLRMSLSFGDASHPGRRAARVLMPFALLQVLVDDHKGFDPQFDRLHGSVYLLGHWQSERYFADFADAIRNDFAFRKSPSPAVRQMLDQITAANAVAIHVRRGDYVTQQHINRIHGSLGLAYYQAAIDTLRGRVGGSPQYFVFSDDPGWTADNLAFDAPTTYVTGNTAVDDLRLMAACRHFVIPNSTFSWWAAWLNSGKDKVIVAPKHWFAEPHPSDADKVPAGWITLDISPAATS